MTVVERVLRNVLFPSEQKKVTLIPESLFMRLSQVLCDLYTNDDDVADC